MAKEAISLYIESLKDHGEDLPTDDETLEYTLMVKAHAQDPRNDAGEDHKIAEKNSTS